MVEENRVNENSHGSGIRKAGTVIEVGTRLIFRIKAAERHELAFLKQGAFGSAGTDKNFLRRTNISLPAVFDTMFFGIGSQWLLSFFLSLEEAGYGASHCLVKAVIRASCDFRVFVFKKERIVLY